MFTLAEDEILSVAVKKYPALYDKKIKGYKDNVVNINAWCEVADECYKDNVVNINAWCEVADEC